MSGYDWCNQIGATTDFEEAAEKKKKRKIWRTRRYNPFDLFYKDFRLWHTDKSFQDINANEVRIRRKAIKAWHNLNPSLKDQYNIMVRVQMAQDKRWLKELLKNRKRSLNKGVQQPMDVSYKRHRLRAPKKHRCKVIIAEPSIPRQKVHRTVVRRPTPVPENMKRKRPKELPKFVPLPVKRYHSRT